MSFFNKLFKSQKNNPQQTAPLLPEEYWEVKIAGGTITIIDPDMRTFLVKLRYIHTISIFTNDQGPWVPDAWLWLGGDSFGQVSFPLGCRGYEDVYNVISKFNNFDFEQVIKAMSSTNNAEFILWKRRLNI